MNRVLSTARILAFVFGTGFVATSSAAIFQNGSFEIGTPDVDPCNAALPVGSTAITSWTVVGGDINYLTPLCWNASDGALSLDLIGNGTLGGIQQTFDTVPGRTYEVIFDLSGNPGLGGAIRNLTVDVNGTPHNYTFNPYNSTSGPAGNMQWTPHSFQFVGPANPTSQSTITFTSTNAGGFAGAALDNVRVLAVPVGAWSGGGGTVYSGNHSSYPGLPKICSGTGATWSVNGGPFSYPTYFTGFGVQGPLIASYAVPGGNTTSGICGTWTTFTTSSTGGNFPVNFQYTGDHASSQTTVNLQAFVINGPTVVVTDLVSSTLAQSFGYVGTHTFVVPPGGTYGFTMTGSNFDFHDTMHGTLYVTGTGSTTLPILSTANPAVAGQTFTLTGVVNGNAPTGTVTFNDNLNIIPGCNEVPLVPNGPTQSTASCNTSSLIVGGHGITAAYSGDMVNLRANNMFVQTISATPTQPTTTSLGIVPSPAVVGSTVALTATVLISAPPATGTVTFYDNFPPIAGCAAVPLSPTADPQIFTASCFTSTLTVGGHTIVANFSGDSNNSNSGDIQPLTITAVAPIAAPTLVRAVALAGSTFVIGRSTTPGSIAVDAFKAGSCSAGALVGGTAAGSFVTTTDAQGYFAVTVPAVISGNFVTLQQTSPATGVSGCIASSGDNDYWPKALDFLANPSLSDYIDAPGKARWYKFSITPGQKVQVQLSGLPADYDVVVFKDIKQAFLKQLVPTDATALTKLNAEFAPSTFSPSTFSPSTFSPSTFSPDAYAPSTFSPSTFSSSLLAPSTFSPSTFSPSTFSPSTFSPSTFSPSTFSPSTFSPSTFSPSTFSPSTVFNFNSLEVQQAFSSAQTRSIIGVSATPGAVNETVVVNTWNETGDFYVRIAGRGDAFSTSGQFTLSVAKGPTTCTGVTPSLLPPLIRPASLVTGVKTVILTDSTKVTLGTLVSGVTLSAKLQSFASRSDIAGAIVDVSLDPRVSALKVQANAHKDCPYATNLVAEEIKAIVDSYRTNNPGLRYVVIVGNDSAIPFFRYPDETLIGQESGYDPPVASATISDASLSQDFVLSQDAYGAKIRISMRSIEFPVPGLAVGRLLETPAEIAGLIDAYTSVNGVITPTSSLVTGYDFLADAAGAVTTELQSGTGVAPQMLITANGVSPQDPQSWTATQLGTALLGSRHDVVFLAGHFSANSALAADFTTSLLTTELAASSNNFTNSIVFSAGCHAGYNIVDSDAITGVTVKLDWAQAFAQKGATLVAGTGYQYGDTDFIEYSERLYKNFARQLRAGTAGTPIAVGEALARAKLDYIAVTPDIRGIHQKAVLEATVFGLPMLSVNMPAGRGAIAPDAGVVAPVLVTPSTSPGAQLGLRTADITGLTPTLTQGTTCLKTDFNAANPATPVVPPCTSSLGYTLATWLNGPDGVVSNPAEPVLPLQVVNVTPTTTNIALRGVGFLGGTYTDTAGLVPLTGAPTTEIRGVHTSFSSPYFFPMRLSTTNYFAALSGMGGTRLLVTPAQHRADDLTLGTSVLRKYSGLNLRLFYSDNTTATALSAAPTIASVSAVTGGGVTFSARVLGDPAAAIHDVWVTYTGGTGTWASVPLTQCSSPPPGVCGTTTDTQLWMGQLAAPPGNLKYIVQAVNGVGLVSLDDNLGAYYSFATSAPPPAAATTLTLSSPPTMTITYGQTPAVNATLSSPSGPIGSAALSISAGGTSATATTNASGVGTTSLAKVAPGTYQIVASYAGSASYLPSTASSSLLVNPAPSSFVDDSVTIAPAAFLVAQVGAIPQQPVTNELVTFAVSQSGTTLKYVTVRTDYTGRAALPATGLPIGTYNVTASFAGSELYLGTSLALGNLQVTTPCPLGEKTKVRWHYSANGSSGNWATDKSISCADGSVAFAAQATEGALTVAPGTTLKFGYALQLPGNKTHFNALVSNARAVFQVTCVSGAAPSASTFALTIPSQTVLLDGNSWNPSSNKSDPLTYQGSGPVPDLCAGGQLRLNQGGSFSAFITLN